MDQRRLERLLASLHGTATSTSVLHRICVVCADTTFCFGAGLSRLVDGHQEVITGSSPEATAVERLQVTLAEGPCAEVLTTFEPFFEPELSSTRALDRWPAFARSALQLGVEAAFAMPLLNNGIAVGALHVYSRTRGNLGTEHVKDVTLLAELAALAVHRGDGQLSIEGVAIEVEPAEPWAHSAIVHNASGMVAEQLGIDVDSALLRLRSLAFATDRRVIDISRDVVDRRVRIESWAAHD
jgi:hypothetical protein